MKNNLSIQEELDFAYLLELMPALHDTPEFSWLPELFSIIGHERLITLCKYAGGETIQIPKLDELATSVEALQNFYDIYIKKSKPIHSCPAHLSKLVSMIASHYDTKDNR